MERQYLYRIKYRRPSDANTNYHYYNAETAEQALKYQNEAIEHHEWVIELLQVEKQCPWTNRWQDESHVLTKTNA